jgi:hypothetical protein
MNQQQSQITQQTLQTFLSHENMQLLWEVIIDDDNKILQTKTREGLAQINQSFNQNVKMFYEKEVKDKLSDPSKPLTLVNMNKRFIASMSAFLRKKENTDYEFKPLSQIQKSKEILNEADKIDKSNSKIAITKEDIENERMTLFERELEKKRNDFTTTITKPMPPVPNFQDDTDKEKPLNLEEEMKRIVEQRQYDTIPIPSTISSMSSSLLEEDLNKKTQEYEETKQQIPLWLKPQETKDPVKFLKIGKNIDPIDIEKYNNNKNINSQPIISNLDGLLKQKRNIKWSDQIEKEYIYDNNIIYESNISQNTDINTSNNSLNSKIDYIISKINTIEQELAFIKSKI